MERWYKKLTYYCQREGEDILVLGNMHVLEIIFLQVSGGFSENYKKGKRHKYMDGKTHNCISPQLNLENFMPCLKCQLMKYIRL